MEVFLQALVNGILLGGFYSLMGMGQNIIFGVMNIVNFCHGEMLMVGMYITYVLYTYFGVDPYVALPIVAVLMFGLGALIQNPIGAEVVGINVKKIYILTYGLGVALAGIAGSLLTQFYTIYPTAGASFGFRALIVVVVGGLGSIPGAFFAGIFLGLLEQMSALFISPSYSDMIVFVTFIIILVVRQVMILRRR